MLLASSSMQKLHAQQSRQGTWLALPLPAVAVLRLRCLQHAGKEHRTSCDDPASAATAALVSPGCPEVLSLLLGEGWSCACESSGASPGPVGCSAWRRASCPCLAPSETTPAPWAALVHLHKTVRGLSAHIMQQKH